MFIELTQAIVDAINNRPISNWSDMTPAELGGAQPTLDPESRMEQGKDGLYVIPMVSVITGPVGRPTSTRAIRQFSIGVVIAKRFEIADPLDVSDWNSIKRVISFREELEDYIASKFLIEAIESEPAGEIELKQRWFIATSEIVIEKQVCLPNE